MMNMTFDEIFEPIKGCHVWAIRHAHGSHLLMEFGNPHLKVREPRTAEVIQKATERVAALFRRRLVIPTGDFGMNLLSCHWRIQAFENVLDDSDIDESKIKLTLEALEGQKLTSALFTPADSSCRFEFDLGGIIETFPYEGEQNEEDDQWCLHYYNSNLYCLNSKGILSKE